MIDAKAYEKIETMICIEAGMKILLRSNYFALDLLAN